MEENHRPVCPIPHLGFCVRERCNFWDEDKQECSGLCFEGYTPLEPPGSFFLDSPCTIYWTEDED